MGCIVAFVLFAFWLVTGVRVRRSRSYGYFRLLTAAVARAVTMEGNIRGKFLWSVGYGLGFVALVWVGFNCCVPALYVDVLLLPGRLPE